MPSPPPQPQTASSSSGKQQAIRKEVPIHQGRISGEARFASLQSSSSGSETEKPSYEGSSSSHGMASKRRRESNSDISGSASSSKAGSDPSKDDWSEVTSTNERRRIQNRIAQRKFREKTKERKAAAARDQENQARAGYAYATPEADDLDDTDTELSGLPWGSLSLKHVVSRGKAKERSSQHGGSGSLEPLPSTFDYGSRTSGKGSGSGRGGGGSGSDR